MRRTVHEIVVVYPSPRDERGTGFLQFRDDCGRKAQQVRATFRLDVRRPVRSVWKGTRGPGVAEAD